MISITVIEINENRVAFTSSLGNGVAIWAGEQPRIGDCYHVEFDLDDIFEWGKNINCVKDDIFSINIIDDKLSFVAQVISYEDDGILTVSLGSEIIFLDVTTIADISTYVSFFTSIDNVSLYPVEF